jgi:hypothetical protein
MSQRSPRDIAGLASGLRVHISGGKRAESFPGLCAAVLQQTKLYVDE